MGLVIAMGIVTFFNLLVLKIKYEKGRTADLIMDVAALIVLNYFFGGTLTGMLVAMIASLCMSIYLWFWPPKFELWNQQYYSYYQSLLIQYGIISLLIHHQSQLIVGQPTKQQTTNDQPTVLTRTTESENPIKYSNQFCTAQEKSEHMQSQYWFNLKQYRLALANYVCESCGTSGPLELHHVDYSNLLAENINDVRVICRQCHQAVHNRLGYNRTTLFPIKDLT